MPGPVADLTLLTARAAAGAGAWGDVRAQLEREELTAERVGARAILLAEACLRTGDPRTATRWLDTAAPMLASAGDRPGQRRVVNMQGAAAFALGMLDAAAERFGTALEMARTDGDALLIAAAGGAQFGRVSVDAQGRITYVPQPGYSGADQFFYTVGDGRDSAQALVQLQVNDPYAGWRQGTAGADAITGDARTANSLYGGAGDDALSGGLRDDPVSYTHLTLPTNREV